MIEPLIEKEVKDLLRDPRIFLPFTLGALILPVLGFIIAISMHAAVEEAVAGVSTVGLLDLDKAYVSTRLASWLEERGVRVVGFTGVPRDALAEEAVKRGVSLVIILPEGFGEAVLRKKAVNLTLFSVVEELSLFGGLQRPWLRGWSRTMCPPLCSAARGSTPQSSGDPCR